MELVGRAHLEPVVVTGHVAEETLVQPPGSQESGINQVGSTVERAGSVTICESIDFVLTSWPQARKRRRDPPLRPSA